MSYDNNPYSTPEKYGLISFGDIDFSSGYYEFDITAVLRRVSDGAFFYVSDSGCSCPCPFENTKLSDLTPLDSLEEFQKYCADRRWEGEEDRTRPLVVNLLERLHAAGVR